MHTYEVTPLVSDRYPRRHEAAAIHTDNGHLELWDDQGEVVAHYAACTWLSVVRIDKDEGPCTPAVRKESTTG